MGLFKSLFSKSEANTELKNEKEFDFTNVTLMFKDEKVADIKMKNGQITNVSKIYDINLLPLGVINKHYNTDVMNEGFCENVRMYLDVWNGYRRIPNARTNISEALNVMGIKSTAELSCKSLSLSLNDRYWLKPDGCDFVWNDINLYTNKYSYDVGDILFDSTKIPDKINLTSPDATTNGVDLKRWMQDDNNVSYIMKASCDYEQVAFNEEIASAICNRLNLKSVQYSVITRIVNVPEKKLTNKTLTFAVGKNFCNGEVDFIPADFFRVLFEKKNSKEIYDFLWKDKELKEAFQKMVTLDFLMNNEDRHTENYGFLYNDVKLTLAPIYDSGNSLYYDTTNIKSIGLSDRSKMPTTSHLENIKLVFSERNDCNWFKDDMLDGVDMEIENILNNSSMSKDRINAIVTFVNSRIEMLKKHIKEINAEVIDEKVDRYSKSGAEKQNYYNTDKDWGR